jgi:thiol-disulfide isomerase/thioredoxin/uncharacterized membrane protein YphA (DoxX/SURF4 family)
MSILAVLDLVARLLLAGMFAAAGVAKLAQSKSSIDAARAFGVPETFVRAVATGLPLVELLAAALLVPAATARWGALMSILLLLVFLAAMTHNLRHGRTPPCNCFGQSDAKPIGRHSIMRNLLLMLVAGGIVGSSQVAGPVSAARLLEPLTAGPAVQTIIGLMCLVTMAVMLFVLVQILRQQGRILLRLDGMEQRQPNTLLASQGAGLEIGARAPRFDALGLDGQTLASEHLTGMGRPVLMVFTNPGCAPCNALLPEIAAWQHSYAETVSIWLVSEGTIEENRGKNVANVLLQKKREVAESHGAWGTPAAVLVRPDGLIGSRLAQGAAEIRKLLTAAVSDAKPNRLHGPPRPDGLAIGDRAPTLEFQDFAGNTARLNGFRGRPIVVLFWNPGCGFCRAMIEDLRDLASRGMPESSSLLIFSITNDDALRGAGAAFAVFSDHDRKVANAFGANGTPMAIEIDADGLIASQLVGGKAQVLALIAGPLPDRPFASHATAQA